MRLLTKKTGMSPIEDLRREMDHLFDEMVPFSWFREEENGLNLWSPNTDMVETDSEYIIKVDLPGIPKKDVKINFQDNRLTISGERTEEEKEEKKSFLRRERYHGSFMRSYTLPNAVKEDGIKATFNEGVLTVVVQKTQQSKPKNITIE